MIALLILTAALMITAALKMIAALMTIAVLMAGAAVLIMIGVLIVSAVPMMVVVPIAVAVRAVADAVSVHPSRLPTVSAQGPVFQPKESQSKTHCPLLACPQLWKSPTQLEIVPMEWIFSSVE